MTTATATAGNGSGMLPAKSWRHFVAGGYASLNFGSVRTMNMNLGYRLGGMCGAIVTAPLDVVKTRLQSSLYQDAHRGDVGGKLASGGSRTIAARASNLLWHFVETGHILR